VRKVLISLLSVFALLFALNSAQASHFGVRVAFAAPSYSYAPVGLGYPLGVPVVGTYGYPLPLATYALPPVALPAYAAPNVIVQAAPPTVAEAAPVVPVQSVYALPVVAAVPTYGFGGYGNVAVFRSGFGGFGNTVVLRGRNFGNAVVFNAHSFGNNAFAAGFRAGVRADNFNGNAAFRAGFRAGAQADGRGVNIGLINIGR